jgi:hypothetical protein
LADLDWDLNLYSILQVGIHLYVQLYWIKCKHNFLHDGSLKDPTGSRIVPCWSVQELPFLAWEIQNE